MEINKSIEEYVLYNLSNTSASLFYDVDELQKHACLGGFADVMKKLDRDGKNFFMLVRHVSSGVNPNINYEQIFEDIKNGIKNIITLETKTFEKGRFKGTLLKFTEKTDFSFFFRYPFYATMVVILRAIDTEYHTTWTHDQKVDNLVDMIYNWFKVHPRISGHTINENMQRLFTEFEEIEKRRMFSEKYIDVINRACTIYNEDTKKEMLKIFKNFPNTGNTGYYYIGQTPAYSLLELYSNVK